MNEKEKKPIMETVDGRGTDAFECIPGHHHWHVEDGEYCPVCGEKYFYRWGNHYVKRA